jgi:hypothetical protein
VGNLKPVLLNITLELSFLLINYCTTPKHYFVQTKTMRISLVPEENMVITNVSPRADLKVINSELHEEKEEITKPPTR